MKAETRNLQTGARPRRTWIGYFGLVLLSFAMSVGALVRGWPGDPHLELPVPHIHDEYSYLLAADTFSHGRLTNPVHPMWRFLQTFYVLQRPSYQSKYPPGEGIVLAAGQVLAGVPVVGVWIATAALVLAAAWMLGAFVPRPWAIAGAAVLAVHPQIVQWSRIYWGGTPAALGGVLLLGAYRRLRETRRWRWMDAIAMSIGLGILMNTRPYEGLAAAVPVGVALSWRKPTRSLSDPGEGRGESDFEHWTAIDGRNHPHPGTPKDGTPIRSLLPPYREGGPERALPAILAVLIAFTPFALWTAYYNDRVTGGPLTLPYLVYEQQYAAAPPLLIEPVRPVPAGIPAEMREYAENVELPHFQRQRTVDGFLASAHFKIRELLEDVTGVKADSPGSAAAELLISLVTAMAVLAVHRDRSLRMPAAILVFVTAATLLSNWTRSQYVAPATGALLVLLTAAVRELEIRVRRAGAALAVAMAIALAAMSFIAAGRSDAGSNRAAIARSLAAEPGKQLVLVRYLPNHRPDDEWVENGADIDGAQTVWARDFGPEEDKPLLAYFHDRAVWRLTVGHDSVSIVAAK